MPKSAKSVDCPCGGYYTKNNKTNHFRTKKHQKYEKAQQETRCRHCGEEAEIDKDTTECSNCGMYQDIDIVDE